MSIGVHKHGFHPVDPAYERAMTEGMRRHVTEVNRREAEREDVLLRSYGLSTASAKAMTGAKA